jgi:membrane associated rhomboid family serine protease
VLKSGVTLQKIQLCKDTEKTFVIFRFPRKPVPVSQQLRLTFQLFLIVGLVEVINLMTGRSLNMFGIVPRETFGLTGIFTAPFIHGNLTHFVSNLPPLLLFTLLTFQHGKIRFWSATLGIVVLGGLAVWLFGRSSIHIGASGVIFGYFGFLLVAGFVSKEFKLTAIALFVGLFYGGMLWGVLPVNAYISFESHLFGLLAGAFMALLIGSAKR